MSKKTKNVNKKPSTLLKILGLYSPFKKRIILIMIMGVIGIIAYSFMPEVLNQLFNELDVIKDNLSPDMAFVFKMIFLYLLLAAVNEVFYIVCMITIVKLNHATSGTLAKQIKNKIDSLPIEMLEKYSTGDMIRRTLYDASSSVNDVLAQIFTTIRVLFFYVTTAIAMLSISVELSLVVFASLPVTIILARVIAKRTQKVFNASASTKGQLNNTIEQNIKLAAYLKLNGKQEETLTEFVNLNNRNAKWEVLENTFQGLNGVSVSFVSNFMNILITVLCSIFIAQGKLLFGALPAFLGFTSRFLSNSSVVTSITNLAQKIAARSERVFSILDNESMWQQGGDKVNIADIKGDIEFKKVTFVDKYNGKTVLKDVSFKITAGSHIAIVGGIGSGKTSVLKLISKIFTPTSGTILVDGIDITKIDNNDYLSKVGVAWEEPWLFKGTIAENLQFGVGNMQIDQIAQTTIKLKSDLFIESLKEGYSTMLYEQAGLLSLGQKQAINVARVIITNPDLTMLDESVSAADSVTEREIYKTIMQMKAGKTTIFTASRVSSIVNCDSILVFKQGRLVEQGTHEELMKRKKVYYNLISK